MPRPLLSPPCPGWRKDLPGPFEIATIEKSMGQQVPNHQDSIYLEIPRSTLTRRGIMLILALPAALIALSTPQLIYESLELRRPVLTLLCLCLLVLAGWATAIAYRTGTSPPRDEPIRFNRMRNKIYIYKCTHRWWNPFEKCSVMPVRYDWSQVRAEQWRQHCATGQGATIIKWGVTLSIVAPGTNAVIDRVHLTCMGADEHAWAYIRTYMQEGPSALPPPGTPKDHNDVLWCELALRLAPKVAWPADMDLESRTAP